MKACFKKCFNSLNLFDLYGCRIEFYLNKNFLSKTKFGGFISLALMALALYMLSESILNWYSGSNYQILLSSLSWNYNELLDQNMSFPYYFNEHTYEMYFILAAWLSNGTSLKYEQLQPYFTQSIYYTPKDGPWQKVNFSKCLNQNQDIFLEISPEMDPAYNETSNYSICLDQNTLMGIFSDPKLQTVNITGISYIIDICQNTTENNNSCANEADIIDLMSSLQVQISVPKSIYDFTKSVNPRKRTYDYQYYYLSNNFFKWFSAILKPVILKTDYGLISEDYRTDNVDFNVDNLLQQFDLRAADGRLFQYDFVFGTNMDIYYRKNDKLNTILANFGGTLNLLLMIGGILCKSYNFIMMKHKLINISFRNLEEEAKSQKKKMYYYYL